MNFRLVILLQKIYNFMFFDVVQALLLMRNLSINLTSPDFEDHVSNTLNLHSAHMYKTS